MTKIFVSLFFFLSSLSSYCEVELSGHNKFSSFILESKKESSGGLVNQTRLNLNLEGPEEINFDLATELGLLYLSNPKLGGGLQNPAKEYRLIDLPEFNWNKKKDQRFFSILNLDRLNFSKSFSFLDFTIGRQALSYGVSNFVSPISLFQRSSKLAFDSEYARGLDAIKLVFPLGSVSELEVTHVFTKENKANASLLRVKFPLWITETQLTGVYFSKNVLIGLSQQFPIEDFEIFSEMAYTIGNKKSNYFRGSWGLQYYFSSEILANVEYHFNAPGSEEKSKKYDYAYADGGVYLRNKHYISLSASKTFNDLKSVFVTGLMSLEETSFLLTVASEYSALDDLYLQVALNYLFAPKHSQERVIPNTISFSLKKYF